MTAATESKSRTTPYTRASPGRSSRYARSMSIHIGARAADGRSPPFLARARRWNSTVPSPPTGWRERCDSQARRTGSSRTAERSTRERSTTTLNAAGRPDRPRATTTPPGCASTHRRTIAAPADPSCVVVISAMSASSRRVAVSTGCSIPPGGKNARRTTGCGTRCSRSAVVAQLGADCADDARNTTASRRRPSSSSAVNALHAIEDRHARFGASRPTSNVVTCACSAPAAARCGATRRGRAGARRRR